MALYFTMAYSKFFKHTFLSLTIFSYRAYLIQAYLIMLNLSNMLGLIVMFFVYIDRKNPNNFFEISKYYVTNL